MATELPRVLFVSETNTGRSQMAAAFYQELTGQETDSAGLSVEEPAQPLSDIPEAHNVLLAMHEVGLDLADNEVSLFTEADMGNYDLIVALVDPGLWPGWLHDEPDVISWAISEIKGLGLDETKIIRDEIEQRIKELVLELES